MVVRAVGQRGGAWPSVAAASAALLGVAISAAAGCGSSVELEGGGGTTGSGTGTTSTTSTSSSSATVGSVCDDFLPPSDLGGEVEIRLVNATGADLFLGEEIYPGCGGFETFELFGASGDPPPLYDGVLGDCEYTCAALQTSPCHCGGSCEMPYVIRIVPGGAHVTSWGGYVYQWPAMPAECFLDPMCGPVCPLETKAPASLVVRSLAYREVSCAGSSCTCTPDAAGSCRVYDGSPVVVGATWPGEALWHEGMTSVTVTFGP